MGKLGGEDAEFFAGILKSLQKQKKLGEHGVEYDPYRSPHVEGEVLAIIKDGKIVKTQGYGQADIKNDYNPSTGEELNVVSENTVDQPWYQRKFMRVDWSMNLVDTPLWSDMFIGKMFGDISLQPGETSSEFIAWYQPLLGTYNTSALVYGDYYYTLLDRGFLTCHDATSGLEIYGRQRIAADAALLNLRTYKSGDKAARVSRDVDVEPHRAAGVQPLLQLLAPVVQRHGLGQPDLAAAAEPGP